ncbi:hypothetical protein BKH43_07420 [Helicobacter sp. 13S00401-1]|uniref:hypothetical protein n=1 Tax=Helicobacter sp. 13S00401-1 TaxID=1905758 RepID=UPI000BA5BEF7|nr:hypothetical protein [Helicobacter sp. 13S00401-1]PAF49014.1 hypothetical protein BKH43_07420 [Helicobacter sp. 13S00401-1]
MGFALLANPIGLIATGIALVAGIIIYYWKPISTFFKGFFKGFSEGAQPLMPLLKGIWDMVKIVFAPITLIFNALFGNLQKSTHALDDFSSTGEKVGKAIAGVFNYLADLIASIVGTLSSGIGKISDFISFVGDKLGLETSIKLAAPKAPANLPKASELQSLPLNGGAKTTTNSSVTNANTITIVTGADAKEVVRAVATYSD